MDDEKLVELVHHFPCLWQVSCKEYKDTRAKENAWKEIAGQAGKGFKGNIEECQRRWKTIRDRFVRELKKVKARKTGDEGPPYKPTWPLFETLLFLQDTVRHRQTQSNFSTTSTEETSETISTQEETVHESQDNSDTVDSFPSSSLSPSPSVSDTPSTNTDLLATPSMPPSKKRKLKGIDERRKERQDDEDELFGRQIAATLRRLSNRQKALCKL